MFLDEKMVGLLPPNFFVRYPVNSFIGLVDKNGWRIVQNSLEEGFSLLQTTFNAFLFCAVVGRAPINLEQTILIKYQPTGGNHMPEIGILGAIPYRKISKWLAGLKYLFMYPPMPISCKINLGDFPTSLTDQIQ